MRKSEEEEGRQRGKKNGAGECKTTVAVLRLESARPTESKLSQKGQEKMLLTIVPGRGQDPGAQMPSL